MSTERLTELVEALAGEVAFELDGRRYRVGQHPLSAWLAALLDGSPDALIPALLVQQDAAHLYDLLTDPWEPLDPSICEDAGHWVIEVVGGRPWWEVVRLARVAMEAWNALDGWCLERGLNPEQMSLRRLCTAVVRFVLSTLPEPEDREAWLDAVRLPPGGDALADRPEWSDEAIGDSFDAVFSSIKG